MPTLGRDLRRVVFAAPSRAADGGGGAVLTWTDTVTCDAGFTTEDSSEQRRAGVMSDSTVVSLIIRESAAARAIAHDWSVMVSGERWAVRSVGRIPGSPPWRLRVVIERGEAIAP